jgi:hypothetical protein
MTREQAIKRFRKGIDKQLKWIDFSSDFETLLHSIYDDFEDKVCDSRCKHYLSQDGKYPIDPCGECSRFYADKFERKRQ